MNMIEYQINARYNTMVREYYDVDNNNLRDLYNFALEVYHSIQNVIGSVVQFEVFLDRPDTDPTFKTRSLALKSFSTYEIFENKVTSWEDEEYGSDTGGAPLDFTFLRVLYTPFQNVYGSSSNFVFKVVNLESKPGDWCGTNCFKYLYPDVDHPVLKTIEEVAAYAEKNYPEISIIFNLIVIKMYNGQAVIQWRNLYDTVSDIFKSEKGKYLIWDEVSKHVDVISTPIPELDPDVQIIGYEVFKNNIKIHHINESMKKTNKILQSNPCYAYFKYTYKTNTTSGTNGPNKVVYDQLQLYYKGQFFLFDNLEDFLTWIGERSFIFVGYDNNKIDNFTLHMDLINNKCRDFTPNINVNGTMTLKFGIHSTFDLSKFYNNAVLSELATKYKIENLHILQQYEFLHNSLNQTLNNTDPDVLNSYKTIEKKKEVRIRFKKNHNSLNSLGYDILKKHINFINEKTNKNNIKPPKVDREWWELLDKYSTGARIQLFQKPREYTEPLVVVDMSSQYGYIAAVSDILFPLGDATANPTGKELPNSIYLISYDQSLSKVKYFNNKKDKSWEVDFGTTIANSFQVTFARNLNIKIEILKGVHFDKHIEGCYLFEPLLELMKIKNDEDKLPNRDEVKRTLIKNIIVGAIGKLGERIWTEKIIHCSPTNYFNYVIDINTRQVKPNFDTLSIINGEMYVKITTPMSDNQLVKQKPRVWYITILAHAKHHMFVTTYQQYVDRMICTNTDSAVISEKDFEEWYVNFGNVTLLPYHPYAEKYIPELKGHPICSKNSKVPGSFAIEAISKGKSIFINTSLSIMKNAINGKDRVRCYLTLEPIPLTEAVTLETYNQQQLYNYYNDPRNQINNIKNKPYSFFLKLLNCRLAVTKLEILVEQTEVSLKKYIRGGNNSVTIEDTDNHNKNFGHIIKRYSIFKI